MFGHLLVTFVSMTTVSVHAARLPKPPAPLGCELLLTGQKIVFGEYPERLEEVARAAVIEELRGGGEDWVKTEVGRDVRAALVLAEKAVFFLIDRRIEDPSGRTDVVTYAVRVSPDEKTELTLHEANHLPTAEQTVEKMIGHEGLVAAEEDFPIGTPFPGVWAGGGAPKITNHTVAMTIATGTDRGVAVIELWGENVTVRKPRMYVVAEVRDGELYSLTDPVFKVVEPLVTARPAVDVEDVAKRAAVEYLVATHVPEVYRSTVQARVVRTVPAGAGFNVSVEVTFVTRGISGIREAAHFIVNVSPDGRTRVERDSSNGNPQALLTRDRAITSVSEYIAKITPHMKVTKYDAYPVAGDEFHYTVYASVNMGPAGEKKTIFRVSVGSWGEILVRALAAQG